MRRGEVWRLSGGADYAGKPRPAVIIQDDRFSETQSIVVCLLTSDETDAPLFRVPVEPGESNGLRLPSRVMVDKIAAVPKSKLGKKAGELSDSDMVQLNRAVLVFLGLAAYGRQGGDHAE
jgi:mRNA interferase MazF